MSHWVCCWRFHCAGTWKIHLNLASRVSYFSEAKWSFIYLQGVEIIAQMQLLQTQTVDGFLHRGHKGRTIRTNHICGCQNIETNSMPTCSHYLYRLEMAVFLFRKIVWVAGRLMLACRPAWQNLQRWKQKSRHSFFVPLYLNAPPFMLVLAKTCWNKQLYVYNVSNSPQWLCDYLLVCLETDVKFTLY